MGNGLNSEYYFDKDFELFLNENIYELNSIINQLFLMKKHLDSIENIFIRNSLHEFHNHISININELQISQDILMRYINCLHFKRQNNCFAVAPSPCFDLVLNFVLVEWWAQAYPIIEQIATVTGAVTGVATVTKWTASFVKWCRKKFQEKKVNDEIKWIELILNEDAWNVFVLSKQIELEENEIKKILKGFGYVWDKKK